MLTEEELLQLELSLNRLAEDGAWDTERLKSKFEQLIEYNVDLTFTGFETAEIDNILSFEVIEPEDQDWTATDPVTQVGDIWRLGITSSPVGMHCLLMRFWVTFWMAWSWPRPA
jgi:hypothetical protein